MRITTCLALIASLILLVSCEGKDEPIPAYLRIDSFNLAVSSQQGSDVHEISSAYVYTPDGLIGLFELPATIPVLKTGKVQFTIVPAMKLNGSNNRLAAHSHFVPVDSVVELQAGKIASISTPALKFRTNTQFLWTEDFEDNSSTLIPSGVLSGDTTFISTEYYSLNGRYNRQTKVFLSRLNPTDTARYIDLVSFKKFTGIPNDGRDVILEFDVKSELPVDLIVRRENANGTELVPYLHMFATGSEWKHFYVNLVYEVGAQPLNTEYQLILSINNPPSQDMRKVLFDNIRLTYLN